MPSAHLDHFHAGFADVPDRGVNFMVGAELLAPLLATDIVPRVSRIARLPHIQGPVTLYPDATAKPFGFPAGIVVRTSPGWLYPMAAPDMGCGYLVVDTGIDIDPDALEPDALDDAFQELSDAIDLSSATRQSVSVPVMEAIRHGVAAVGAPEHFSAEENPAEESNSWPVATDALDRDFIKSTLQRSLGSAAGHFVACYVIEHTFQDCAPKQGRVVAVVHVGAAPIRDHLNGRAFYAKLAENAIDSGVSTVEDTADGLFAVDLTTPDGTAFIGAAMAARNFGYVNRQIVADRVTAILRRRFTKQVTADAIQIRHVDHVAFEAVDGLVRSRRGLQPLHADRQVFLTGGEHAHAYLGSTGANSSLVDDLCCHGSPLQNVDGFSPYIWEEPRYGADPGEVRRWVNTMAANTDIRPGRFWADVSNMESVMSYLRRADIMRPVARLRQFMNYRETHL